MSISQGYPDWQRQSQWQGLPFVDVPSFAWTPQVTQGPFYVGAWESLFVGGGPASGLAQLLLSWSTDQAGNHVQAQTAYNFGQGVQAQDTIGNAGAWLYATNLPGTGGNTPTAGPMLLVPRQGTARPPISPAYNRVMLVPNTSIGAATTALFFASVITTGPAVLSVYAGATPWTYSLDYFDNVGASKFIGWGENPANRSFGLFNVTLPSGVVRLGITNQSAAPALFAATLHMYR